jgi:hypothetical protein
MNYDKYKYLWDQEPIVLFLVGLLSGNKEYSTKVPEEVWEDVFTKFLSTQDTDID